MRDWLRSPAPGSGGGGGKYLTKWKEAGQVDVFLHTRSLPLAVWQHPWPTLVPIERDGKTTVHVWAKKYTCHETEEVLEKMYFRSVKGDPTSEREHPPVRCGMCKFIEWVWLQCWAWLDTHNWLEKKGDDGKKVGRWVEGTYDDEGEFTAKKGVGKGIDPCERLFRFTSEADDKENTTVHAGGMCGLFGKKEDKMPEALARAMKAHGISPREAWKESAIVKPNVVLSVVNNDKPADGVQIALETKELGEKVKAEIIRVYKSLETDIQKTPYCLRLEFDKSAAMGKMYSATAMMKIAPSPRILKLLRGPAPDLSSLTTAFNQQTMRAVLEKYCLLEKGAVPWDEFFPTREQEKAWREEDEAEGDDETESSDSDDEDVEDEDGEESDDEADESDDDESDDDETVECDSCNKPMKITDSKCPHCGHAYDVEAEPESEPESEPEPSKPKIRTRAEALAAKKAGEKKAEAKSEAKPANGSKKKDPEPELDDAGGDEDDDQDDEIPF